MYLNCFVLIMSLKNIYFALTLTLLVGGAQNLTAKEIDLIGAHGPVKVNVAREAFVRSFYASSPEPLKDLIHRFYQSIPYAERESGNLTVRLFSVTSREGAEPFWFGDLSSLGRKSHEKILHYLDHDFFRTVSGCQPFQRAESAVAALIGGAPHEFFVSAAHGYADLVGGLTMEGSNGYGMDRPIYERRCSYFGEQPLFQQTLFFDPTPETSPDHLAYFVVISHLLVD